MRFKLFVEGKPHPLRRARILKNGMSFDPPENKHAKKMIALPAAGAMRGEPWEDALTMRLVFHMPRPKSHLRKNGELTKRAPIHCVSRPDIDNLIKLVKDALEGIVYKDDSQITHIEAVKKYSPIPGTDIVIEQLEQRGKL